MLSSVFALLQAFASASISFAASLFVAPRGTLSANRHVTERRSLIDRSEVRVCLSLKSTSQTTNIDNVRVSPQSKHDVLKRSKILVYWSVACFGSYIVMSSSYMRIIKFQSDICPGSVNSDWSSM